MVRSWRWLFLTGLGLVILFAPWPVVRAAPVERVYRLTAAQFAYAPSILHANPGDRVTIELSATDVVHGLAVDGYPVELTSDPGQTSRVTFVTDRPGVYRFHCTVTCGNLHPFMIGKLQVGPNTLYWRAAGLSLLALAAGLWKLRR